MHYRWRRVQPVAGRARPPRQGQRDNELATQSMAGAARHNAAAMRLGQFTNHREPDAQAGAVECDGVRVLHEGLEDVGQDIGCNSDAVVGDGHLQRRFRQGDRNSDPTTAWRVLGRVREQIADDLHQADRIALHHERLPWQIRVEALPPQGDEGLGDGQGLGNRVGQVERDQFKPELAVGSARVVEQIAHQPRQVRQLPLDGEA